MAETGLDPWYKNQSHALVIGLVALLGTYGETAIGMLPMMVTGWIESGGLDEATAGYLGSATLGGMTLGLAAAVLLIKRHNHAWVARVGVIIALGADLASAGITAPLVLGMVRVCAGIGYGLVVATIVNWFARHPAADRCFGAFMLLQLLVFATLFVLVRYLTTWLGSIAGFACLFVLGACCLTIVPLLNTQREMHPEKRTEAQGAVRPLALCWQLSVVLAPAVLLVAMVGFWAYLSQLGIAMGIDADHVAQALGAVTLTGVPATLGVIWLGDRWGRQRPIWLGIAGLLMPIGLFWMGPTGLVSFLIGGALFNMAWSFIIPSMQAVQADLDRTGRLAALSTIPQAIGAAIGPAAFALALGFGRFPAGFAMAVVFVVVSLMMMQIPASLADTAPPVAQPAPGQLASE